MACEVCEHCHGTLNRHEKLVVREGFSYHEKCHKCYVCSETNLQDAEMFKGVIFCSSCSQRIFQGCSTARRTKNSGRCRKSRDRSTKRRSHRTVSPRVPNGILQLTSLVTPSASSKSESNKDSKSMEISAEQALQFGKEIYDENTQRNSVEMGMTTEVTQELLKQLKYQVVNNTRLTDKKRKPRYNKSRIKVFFQYKLPCSDLRMAELGHSTEIANMALKHKRELPVIIKSDSRIHPVMSQSAEESGESRDPPEQWIDSAYSSLQESTRTHWMDRRLGSILKLPYNAFKRNILNKSSIVSMLMTKENKETLPEKIKTLFNEDITEHQRRGLKRLYSTINRNKRPNKLGWLSLVNKAHCNSRNLILNKRCNKRCKHFKQSQSYRCMRAHIMRMAGPTRSELSNFRRKVRNVIAPGFLLNMALYHKRYAIMMSQACGNSLQGSGKDTSKTKFEK